jgi:hypothetical protein
VSLIAFVHPTVVRARKVLTKLGYHVIETPLPINISAIPFRFLREKINLNGCCGASELIKLNSYRLLQYDKVVHMDADTILLKSMDNILSSPYSLQYTTDPNMATHKGIDKQPSQGGFLVMTPSETDFRLLIDTIMTTEFKRGGAWNGSKIGWFWGGMTVQGILPYYYNRVAQSNRSLIIDRCLYNTMADSSECLEVPTADIVSAHFTICQKPWTCYANKPNSMCKFLHHKWFETRQLAEAYFGIPVIPNACDFSYRTMKKSGDGKYNSMLLDRVNLSPNRVQQHPIPDQSPNILVPPVPESRYTTSHYDNFVGGHVAHPRQKNK